MTKEEKKISEYGNIAYLSTILKDTPTKLVGGAIIDILDDRIPKDYDCIKWNDKTIEALVAKEFKFYSDTKTAITYINYVDEIIVQLLKTKTEDFDFTIAQATYTFKFKTLTIDQTSYENRMLIPVGYKSNQAKDALLRIPHWRKKGFEIPDPTYYSLLNNISKRSITLNSAMPS